MGQARSVIPPPPPGFDLVPPPPEGFSLEGSIPTLRTAFQKQAAARGLGINVEQHAAEMAQEIANAKGKAAGNIARAGVLGAAALGTGGAAAPLAMGLMGTAGVAGEAADELMKSNYGSTELPKTAREMVNKFGLEGALSAGGEGVARGIGQGLKYLTTEAKAALAMRSAAKSETGQQTLLKLQQDSFGQLRDFTRSQGTSVPVEIGNDLHAFYDALAKRATGTSQAFDSAWKPINDKLAVAGGGTLSKQPLDALLEIKSDLSHVAYKVKGMNSDELMALRTLSDQIDKKIGQSLSSLGGEPATKVWGNYKAFTEQVAKDNGMMDMAETGITKFLGKAVRYVPGVDTAIDEGIRSRVAPAVLERMFSNEKTADLIRRASALQGLGKHREAQAAFEAAINTSDVGTLLKDMFGPQKPSPFAALSQMPGPMVGP